MIIFDRVPWSAPHLPQRRPIDFNIDSYFFCFQIPEYMATGTSDVGRRGFLHVQPENATTFLAFEEPFQTSLEFLRRMVGLINDASWTPIQPSTFNTVDRYGKPEGVRSIYRNPVIFHDIIA